MAVCVECYSAENRITPLLGARECLENHMQYICGTCGRCICISKDKKRGLQRWNFPFKSLEIAKLYLRTADVSSKTSCGIYEMTAKNGRVSFKIFPSDHDLREYLSKNKDKSCKRMGPVFRNSDYKEFDHTQIKILTEIEVEEYLSEMK